MQVLVAVASRHGSTREIADAIAQELQAPGVHAEVRTADEVSDLDSYDAVVLGSAIYMGNWESAASRFAQQHQAKLASMPVWLFSSGPVGDDDHSNHRGACLSRTGEEHEAILLMRLRGRCPGAAATVPGTGAVRGNWRRRRSRPLPRDGPGLGWY